jgi:hypothetical protein
MAKDYFQDILPKSDNDPRRVDSRSQERAPIQDNEAEAVSDIVHTEDSELDVGLPPVPERSIRNINVNRPRPAERPTTTDRAPAAPRMPERTDRREVPPVGSGMPKKNRISTSMWLWVAAGVLLVAVAALALFMFRSTTVTVTPRAQTIVFDSSKYYTAYPTGSAPAGALTYTLQSFEIDESLTVSSSGSTHVERKASGSVTVVNEYSAAPVKLVKSTRFQTPEGLVFRTPADITVPGMKNGTPGTVQVTVVADVAGDKYNVAPVSRFTLPGLKGGAMYDKVYARSGTAFSGGFSGEEPGVEPAARSAAIAQIQGKLRDKILSQLNSQVPSGGTIFPAFASASFEELPATQTSTAGQVNLNQRAHVQVPVLPTQEFDRLIGGAVSADAENAVLTLVAKDGFAASLVNATSTTIGSTPVTFALSGSAQLVWEVDSGALAQALAGKDQSAFQTIVNNFPGVQEARARIEPFWRQSFPADPAKIQVLVTEPKDASSAQ